MGKKLSYAAFAGTRAKLAFGDLVERYKEAYTSSIFRTPRLSSLQLQCSAGLHDAINKRQQYVTGSSRGAPCLLSLDPDSLHCNTIYPSWCDRPANIWRHAARAGIVVKPPGDNVALIIRRTGRYYTYRSTDHKCWPPSMTKISRMSPIPSILS